MLVLFSARQKPGLSCGAMAAAATQQRSQQLGLKSKLAAPSGARCSVRLKFFHKGDLEDRWVEGMYLGLSPTVNNGHVVLRNDGKGHVRTNLVSPDPPPLKFVGDSLEPEHPPPRFRIKGKQGLDERLLKTRCQHLRYEAPPPEGPVSAGEEEELARVARVSLEDLEGFAKELVEED